MREQITISNFSASELDVVNHLINGRNEKNIKLSKKHFENGLAKSKEIFSTSDFASSLYLECLTELVDNEYDIQKRAALWSQILKKVLDFLNQYPKNEENLEHCCDTIISYIQEPFINIDFQSLKKILSILKGKLDSLINYKGIENCSKLLVKKAAILRNFSSHQATPESQKSMLEQALRCVEKSILISGDKWYSYLELGNCYLKYSNYEKNQKTFNKKISDAENAYLKSQDLEYTIHNTLALCRLYKETYQTSPFLSAFKTYEKIEDNRRQFLQNSYLLSETTIRMFYSNFKSTRF